MGNYIQYLVIIYNRKLPKKEYTHTYKTVHLKHKSTLLQFKQKKTPGSIFQNIGNNPDIHHQGYEKNCYRIVT